MYFESRFIPVWPASKGEASKLLQDGRGFREDHETLLGLVVERGTVVFRVERREKCVLREKLRDKHSSFL